MIFVGCTPVCVCGKYRAGRAHPIYMYVYTSHSMLQDVWICFVAPGGVQVILLHRHIFRSYLISWFRSFFLCYHIRACMQKWDYSKSWATKKGAQCNNILETQFSLHYNSAFCSLKTQIMAFPYSWLLQSHFVFVYAAPPLPFDYYSIRFESTGE